MKELYNDQIHSPAFQKLCDFIWSPDLNCPYVNSVIKDHNPGLKIFNKDIPLTESKGVIFIGMCQLIEDCFEAMPKEGKYIIIHRTNDRSFTQAMYKKKPASVKHVYTVDCAVTEPDVTAIPFGLASIDGEDNIIKGIVAEAVRSAETKIFCRYNVNNSGYTKERIASIPILESKPFVKVITKQIPATEFYRQIKSHKFTMSLQGQGKDCSRTYAAMILGSIPIVTECTEMRHFQDMPLVYCPPDLTNDITLEWLNAQDVSGKSTDRIRMSYWENEVNNKRREL